jgi:hypothetical protein
MSRVPAQSLGGDAAGPLKSAGEAIGLIAGVVALVYLLGGIVLALRLAFDRFSVEAIVALIGQLPRETVITAGLVEAIAPAALLGIVAGLGYGLFNRPGPREHPDDRLNKGPLWQLKLVGLVFLAAALVAPAVVWVVIKEGPTMDLWTSLFGGAITYAAVCAGWFVLRQIGRHKPSNSTHTRPWYRLTRAVAAGAVWAGMALVPAVMLAAVIPFDTARVCIEGRPTPQSGVLIADTKERVLIGISMRDRMGSDEQQRQAVVSVPARIVSRVEYGDLSRTSKCPIPARGTMGMPPTTPRGTAATGPEVVLARPRHVRTHRDAFIYPIGRFPQAVTGVAAFVTTESFPLRRGIRKPIRLGTKAFLARAGGTAAVRIALSPFAELRLKRERRLSVRGTVTARDRSGNATTRSHVFVAVQGTSGQRRERGE